MEYVSAIAHTQAQAYLHLNITEGSTIITQAHNMHALRCSKRYCQQWKILPHDVDN